MEQYGIVVPPDKVLDTWEPSQYLKMLKNVICADPACDPFTEIQKPNKIPGNMEGIAASSYNNGRMKITEKNFTSNSMSSRQSSNFGDRTGISISDIIEFLLLRGTDNNMIGWAQWGEFCDHYKIPFEENMDDLRQRAMETGGMNSYLSKNINFLSAVVSSGRGKRGKIKEVNVFKYLSVCSYYNDKKCPDGNNCIFNHICLYYVLEECNDARKCGLNHNVSSLPVFKIIPTLAALEEKEKRAIIRECHPQVCEEYNSTNWPKIEDKRPHFECCRKVHVCDDYVRNKCNSQKKCTRSHDLNNDRTMEILSHFGHQTSEKGSSANRDLNKLIRHVFPVYKGRKDGDNTEAGATSTAAMATLPKLTEKNAIMAHPTTSSSAGSSLGGSRILTSTNFQSTSSNQNFQGDQRLNVLNTLKGAENETAYVCSNITTWQHNEERKQTLCEYNLRGKCQQNEKCKYLHIEVKMENPNASTSSTTSSSTSGTKKIPVNYLWQYKLPDGKNATEQAYYLKILETEGSSTNDGWLAFDQKEGEEIEETFANPNNRSWTVMIPSKYFRSDSLCILKYYCFSMVSTSLQQSYKIPLATIKKP